MDDTLSRRQRKDLLGKQKQMLLKREKLKLKKDNQNHFENFPDQLLESLTGSNPIKIMDNVKTGFEVSMEKLSGLESVGVTKVGKPVSKSLIDRSEL